MKKFLIELICLFIPNKRIRKIYRSELRRTYFVSSIFNYIKYYFSKIEDNTILIVEPNKWHGECLASWLKYLKEIGFNTHLMIRIEVDKMNPLCKVPLKYMPKNKFVLSPIFQKRILRTNKCNKYTKIFIASSECYSKSSNNFIEYIGYNIPEALIVEHDIRNVSKYNEQIYVDNNQLCVLHNFNNDVRLKTVIPLYFGEIDITTKNRNTTYFIVVGALDDNRKNPLLLINAVKSIIEYRVFNFKVILVGDSGKLVIPDEINKYFELKGRLNFPEMFDEMLHADFYLALLDPDNKNQAAYMNYVVTGSRQLVLGFRKPCLLNSQFAQIYGFSHKDSIIYEDNSLAAAMMKAIDISSDDYHDLQKHLGELADELYSNSIENMKVLARMV